MILFLIALSMHSQPCGTSTEVPRIYPPIYATPTVSLLDAVLPWVIQWCDLSEVMLLKVWRGSMTKWGYSSSER